MPDGVIALQVRPAGAESVSPTVPVKPLSAVIVIVDWAESPASADGDDAVIVKSDIR